MLTFISVFRRSCHLLGEKPSVLIIFACFDRIYQSSRQTRSDLRYAWSSGQRLQRPRSKYVLLGVSMVLSDKYVATVLRIVRKRLVQAGVRLGRLLDNAFSDCPTFVGVGRPTDQRMVLPERKPWCNRPNSICRSISRLPNRLASPFRRTCLHGRIR